MTDTPGHQPGLPPASVPDHLPRYGDLVQITIADEEPLLIRVLACHLAAQPGFWNLMGRPITGAAAETEHTTPERMVVPAVYVRVLEQRNRPDGPHGAEGADGGPQ